MKKILGITMAAVCALSVAAFGISACGSKDVANDEATAEESAEVVSVEVTAEEWAAAMTESNFYNVTAKATVNSSYKYTDSDGVVETSSDVGYCDLKLNLTATEAGGYVSGNTYMSYTETESATSTENEADNYTYTKTSTQYEVFTSESYSYVYKRIYSDETEDYWYGSLRNSAQTADYSDAYETAGMLGDLGLEEAYSYFTYSDGAYRYSMAEGEGTYTMVVKINDGYVSYFSVEVKYEDTYTNSADNYSTTEETSYKYEFSYSDYGTTSVTVPEEYTYEYYLANHAN